MSGSSEQELKMMVRSLNLESGFLGTFDCRFPGFISKDRRQTAIVNTGPREQGGVHWIALAWDPTSRKMFLFDPLGWTNAELKKYYGFSYQNMVQRSALSSADRCVTLERNTQAVQCTCAGSCGLFCILFLYCAHLSPSNPFGTSLFQSLDGQKSGMVPRSPEALHKNQQILYNFLSSKCAYFRKNARNIVMNTRLHLIKTH
ncbi:protease [Snake adenovirus 1]|uniref:Protease n=1 Tax=Snake adenovirus serotype 1 TaxID=189830 RepID=PRO_ADES1|nr:protease [Snake adenovirus 1]Q8JN66.1 RecName: Full=Protease; AltName: Full=Adenain; AltName: Full=Adenovirus protease; Short=AVP; AltName: Full=Adenovirus proteinase; AltName: Full=Endoprotease [Snake adenovirus 1]AAL92453.1 protease [Snake adenovirus 1]